VTACTQLAAGLLVLGVGIGLAFGVFLSWIFDYLP
jgi:hypothetical protein